MEDYVTCIGPTWKATWLVQVGCGRRYALYRLGMEAYMAYIRSCGRLHSFYLLHVEGYMAYIVSERETILLRSALSGRLHGSHRLDLEGCMACAHFI